ncbi:peptidoglycan editing factor PgeF [Microbulbifer harenosus]|uniref:Purine nucleoside phosphorylase n=1 Tax=Microbulbifer harenosus TaxID=2576840 RepID=A0ABY2UDQ2_9GAMM|nr:MULTISPECIES: peptidoglycan editing factor PgeF [Microbulbifer]QIL91519.1 peptidoglycan editing factor PgeF [Microbulbifer sp. SH-1]TLM74820.1 peptidoglycan editing factor PgeF [Microbulbifer harenosus]
MAADHYLKPDWPAPTNVRAFVTLRHNGHSAGGYAAFNLADHVGDAPDAVRANRAQLKQELNLPNEPQWLEQIHSDRAVAAHNDGMVRTADASYTAEAGIVCAVLTADCLPLLVCNRDGSEVAAIHAGWRGLTGGVIRETIHAMASAPEDLLVWLGPAIGPEAFECGVEVLEAAFESSMSESHAEAIAKCFVPHSKKPLHFLADIYALGRAELAELGVAQVFGGDRCTVTEASEFFSYRRDKDTGRMASLIWFE